MSMSPNFAQLRTMTDEELIARHDAAATSTVVGTRHYLDELNSRDVRRQTAKMVRLTWVITFLTLVNVVIVAAELLRQPTP